MAKRKAQPTSYVNRLGETVEAKYDKKEIEVIVTPVNAYSALNNNWKEFESYINSIGKYDEKWEDQKLKINKDDKE